MLTNLLRSLDIPAKATQQLASCSIAVQQMVAIARAVDMDCKVLILDEPTSSLDEQEVEKLFTLMRDLRSRGVGIIFVTHFLDQVYEVCDKITVLRDGKLVGQYEIKDLPRVKLDCQDAWIKNWDDMFRYPRRAGAISVARMQTRLYLRQKDFTVMRVSSHLISTSKRVKSMDLPDFWVPVEVNVSELFLAPIMCLAER